MSIARISSSFGLFRRVSKEIMLTRSKVSSIKCDLVVKHNKNKKIFYADIGEHRAFIEYENEGNILNLLETQVPKELEGHGIGKQLAKETFDLIAEKGLKAKVHCDFLKHFIEKYGKEYKKILVE